MQLMITMNAFEAYKKYIRQKALEESDESEDESEDE